jgi:hypothetical protein
MKISVKLFTAAAIAGFMLASCEGPMGPKGDAGADGTDANETCKLCHNNTVVVAKAIEYEHSLHFTGVAFEEGTRNNCAPCHSHQGFLYVVKNNTPATFVADPVNAGKFLNNYIVDAATTALPGSISCFTCHSSLHTEYTADEFFPLATTAAVPMTMYGGSKTINFAKSTANLCAKCHQPRPITNSAGNVIDYSLLVSAPASTYSLSSVSYRTGVHYGTAGAMAAGVGGIEFGSGYSNSTEHTQSASCVTCHMATPSGLSGGHSFSAAANYAGCNTTGCHSSMSANSTSLTDLTNDIKTKLNTLGSKLDAIVTPGILQKDSSTGEYTGYFDVYDPSSNPTGKYKSPSTTGWTTEQKTYNNILPAFTLTNAQFGAAINFQLVMRDGSSGVHNYEYIKKLLENSIAAW